MLNHHLGIFQAAIKKNGVYIPLKFIRFFWNEILPHFQGWESQTWKEVLVNAKKQNHSIKVNELNKITMDRLTELYIEAEAVISLRLTGTHRIYGYMKGPVFNILWIDLKHGDNSTCVCRTQKKHT